MAIDAGTDTQEATSSLKAQEDNLVIKQSAFDRAQQELRDFISRAPNGKSDPIADSTYFLFGNNCASIVSEILDKAERMGAKPIALDPSELKVLVKSG